ncbi:tRNA preQ1(34) S-adenosylmethionine ribosyltransferase-isomerase QueA [Maridesulfovibrio hydrothermalis]|uniref:S-adenosylmethionine:tRNA ribosyltransferase-isomerase n=1 Tax=Maridesulfovibrio hydrothermalis AM13 = DSM 14728 TaxID=1121451 RepID=L0RBU5_9BACT|nr:tRNA preQ1(34) S-adenosylmethionine ribosyltransferase-isomerase QueA [Maridesulfovibrio hydrothermalis]CCO23021.1 S-adenosylmethionine:tRNA ribosyltransferase-isomerase [Maridesulfovibrio hydrothermalis AM13 = DSM 14728]
MKIKPEDFLLENYNFELPENQIAQCPAEMRHGSKLMVLDQKSGETEIKSFTDLPDLLPEGALLVANNSKVIPARIFGQKPTGGRVEFLLLTPLPLIKPTVTPKGFKAVVRGLLRASKSPKPGGVVTFECGMKLTVLGKGKFGLSDVELEWQGDLKSIFETCGNIPLPPYIRRAADETDNERYQTLYACDEKAGSVAAPTAGLHFSEEINKKLKAKGIERAEVTLYVGYGTFSPVRAENIHDHEMHHEYIEIPEETAKSVIKAKEEGRPVIAVGTTSARTLEGAFRETGKVCKFKGETDIFIYPGFKFQVVDRMITNFHLPESSLVIMISALAGRENVLSAYRKAVENEFRFFSYGDSMYIK